MEAVIAEPPVSVSSIYFVPQLHLSSDRAVVVLHWAACSGPAEPALNVFVNVDFSWELLQARRALLLRYLVKALDDGGVAAEAVDIAFGMMNGQLRLIVGEEHSEEGFWRAQNSSLVVIVDSQRVHVFGNRLGGAAFLCRGGVSKTLLPRLPVGFHATRRVRNSRTKFGYFHTEELTANDSYLVVGSAHISLHCAKDFADVLLTRIRAFGMEEACKQIAGRYADGVPRTFLCLRLGEFRNERVLLPSEPSADWGVIGPTGEGEDEDEEDESEDSESFEGSDDDWMWPTGPSPATHLFPLTDGKRQEPAPYTTCTGSVPRSPCIRAFNLDKNEQLEMICKYNECTIVVRVGDIMEWELQGPDDYLVVFDDRGFAVLGRDARIGVPDLLKYGLQRSASLANQCRTFFESPFCQRVRRIAIPEDEFPETSPTTAHKEAADLIQTVIEKAGKICLGLKEEHKEPLIEVHFVLRSRWAWMKYVAATELLAHWNLDDQQRRFKLADDPRRLREIRSRRAEIRSQKTEIKAGTSSLSNHQVPKRLR